MTEPRTEAGRRHLARWFTTHTERIDATADIIAIEAEAAVLDVEALAPHPGEHHEFRTTCLRCGERGMLNVALITDNEVVRIEDRAILAEKQP